VREEVMSGLNFARRPFRNERPVYLAVVLALAAALVFLALNVRLYAGYQKSVAGTTRQIEELGRRRSKAAADIQEARSALESYRVSSLAAQSQGLLKIVAERHFSWIVFLARLERVLPPEVRVTRLAPRFDGQLVRVSMGLIGRDAESVVRTVAALDGDPAFSAIDLKSEQSPEQGVPEGRTFEVDATYAATEAAPEKRR
jgi:Tfp pilus assembly protein PilN